MRNRTVEQVIGDLTEILQEEIESRGESGGAALVRDILDRSYAGLKAKHWPWMPHPPKCDGPHVVVRAKKEIKFEVPITAQELEMIQDLVLTGFYGEDPSECAERLIAERLREIVPDRK